MTQDEPSPIDGAPSEAETLPPPNVTVTFQENGAVHISASPGFAWEHFVKASVLLAHEASKVLDKAEFTAMMQAQEAAQVAAALRGEKQGNGMVPSILDLARKRGNA